MIRELYCCFAEPPGLSPGEHQDELLLNIKPRESVKIKAKIVSSSRHEGKMY